MASSLRVMTAVLVLASCSTVAGDGEAPAAAPLHSIVFVTKRPGGYDVLLEALARQTDRNYELICVDELADHRAHSVRQMAAQLQVNLAAITRSKPKTHLETRFGIANAINTGFILAKGHIVTVLQDNIYLPDFFVERTLDFYRDNPGALISYPELRFVAPDNHVNINFLHDVSSTTVFNEPVREGPQLQGWRPSNEGTMPRALWDNMQAGARGQFDWLECACCSLPYSVMVELNGVDETLDTGDDCHEVNLRDRAKMLDYRTWSEGACPVQLIDHHRWDRSEVWTRFTRDTNIFRWDFMKQQMDFGEYPLRAPNNFELRLMSGPASSALQQGADDLFDGPRVRIVSPARGACLNHPLVVVEFVLAGFALPQDGTVCLATTGQQQSICVNNLQPVTLAVHRRGTHIVHALAYDREMRLLAEHQVAFVQDVPAPVGELGRMARAVDAVSGWVKGEASGVPSGLETDAIQEIFREDHDLPKEQMLFVFNKDPAHYDTWRDGLWAALRILARKYTIQYLNVNDIVVAEQPPINYHLSPGTFKFILGWGAFGSPTDYFLTQLHTVHQDPHPKALCIGGNAVPPHENVTEVYDLLFFETEWYRETIAFHPLIQQAFGINSNIYHKLPPRLDEHGDRIFEWDVLMVGHFLPWKRHLYLGTKEGRRLAVGEIYQEYEVSSQIVQQLQELGVEVCSGGNKEERGLSEDVLPIKKVTNMLPPRELADLYRSSRLVYFPMATVGGGERALLEARACGAQVEVAEDNPKLQYLLRLSPIPDHHTYARQLLQGIDRLLDKVGTRNVTTRPPMPSDETVVEQRIKELIRHTCRPNEYCPYTVEHKVSH